MDSLTLNLNALQRLSEVLPKEGASPSLIEERSWFELSKTLADAIEESVPQIDQSISFIRTNWSVLSEEDRDSLEFFAISAQSLLEEDSVWIQLLLLIPSIRRRKGLYKLLRRSIEQLVSSISDVVNAWEAEREREFEEAASYVLKKNAELHRRLA